MGYCSCRLRRRRWFLAMCSTSQSRRCSGRRCSGPYNSVRSSVSPSSTRGGLEFCGVWSSAVCSTRYCKTFAGRRSWFPLSSEVGSVPRASMAWFDRNLWTTLTSDKTISRDGSFIKWSAGSKVLQISRASLLGKGFPGVPAGCQVEPFSRNR